MTKEHLARINLKDGGVIDIHREDGDIHLSHGEQSVVFPKATARKTIELHGLLESLGTSVEYPEEESHG